MTENSNLMTFIYVVIACAIVMAAVWYFWLAPMERREHDRKMALLQERIRSHQEQKRATQDSDKNNSASRSKP